MGGKKSKRTILGAITVLSLCVLGSDLMTLISYYLSNSPHAPPPPPLVHTGPNCIWFPHLGVVLTKERRFLLFTHQPAHKQTSLFLENGQRVCRFYPRLPFPRALNSIRIFVYIPLSSPFPKAMRKKMPTIHSSRHLQVCKGLKGPGS